MNHTYTIIDLHTYETVAEKQDLDDLRAFVNDLFWNDDISFDDSSYEELYEAMFCCDYDVEIDN